MTLLLCLCLQGKWASHKVPNPAYYQDQTLFFCLTPITSIGLELWTMDDYIFIDNIIIASEFALANDYAKDGYVT